MRTLAGHFYSTFGFNFMAFNKLTVLSNLVVCHLLACSSATVVNQLFRETSKKFSTKFFHPAANKVKMGRKGKRRELAISQKSSSSRPPLQKPPSSINLVVVGTGGPGTSRCLLLTTEYSRYMFNCGEGSQRLTVMNKCLKSSAYAKVSGLENIFITHKDWENTGGLLGIAMLVESQKNPDLRNYLQRQKEREDVKEVAKSNDTSLPVLTLHGPLGIEKITMMARKFAERSNMNIVRKDGVFEDSAIKIAPVVFSRHSHDNENAHETATEVNTAAAGDLSDVDRDQTYAYLCTAKPMIPKINVEKCVDAGITLGPMVGELQRGNPVTLPDGTVVRPEQVTNVLETSANSFLVVECPSEDHFPSLEAADQLKCFRGQDRPESLAIVVHMTPSHILNGQSYRDWMDSFGEGTDHLVMNDESNPADLSRVRNHQAQLNIVHPDVFPLLPSVSLNWPGDDVRKDHTAQSIQKACSGLVYSLRGKNRGFFVETDDLDVATLQKDVIEVPNVKAELDRLRTNIDAILKSKDNSQTGDSQYPRVAFLGTGSSEPNRIRAQSCIAIHLSENATMILDCGEDSFGQLFRFYGQEESQSFLLKLKAIYISHMHGDHHLGLLTLLKERRKAFEVENKPFVPVILMAPIQMKRWLKFYHEQVENVFQHFRFHKHQRALQDLDPFAMDVASDEEILNVLGLNEYNSVEVIHARNSYGITFTHQSGFKLVYSGDTRPCDQLVEAGQGCDLLIHEATHEDDLLTHAQASRHSTFSEAMDVGKRMGAKHIILTHFSQRYPHMVPFYDMSAVPSNVGVAFDNMQVTRDSLPLLHSFIPPLTHIFAEKLQKLELKNLKRNREQANLDDL